MRINISTLLSFKKFRSWFRGSTEFNIIVNDNSFTVMCHKGGITHVTTIPAEVETEFPLPLGFSFYSTLLLNLPSKNKELDELSIIISQTNVAINLNGQVVNVLFTLYNPGAMANFGDESGVQVRINLKELSWILAVSRFYRTDNLQICGNLVYLDTEDGTYYSKLENPPDKNFSFVPALLNRANPETEVILSSKLEIKSESFRTFSSLYKISSTISETLEYARKQKAHIKVTMNLSSHKAVIKSLRAADFITSFTDKRVIITTKENEVLSLPYDSMETDIKTNDFTKFSEMSDLVNSIKLKGYPVHQILANEKKVMLFVTQYANILKFGNNSFLLLRG